MDELIREILALTTYDLEGRNWHDEMRPQRPLTADDLEWYGGGEWVRMEDVLEILKRKLACTRQ